jgi:hypothetical protein
MVPDQREETTCAFTARAIAWFERHGVKPFPKVERLPRGQNVLESHGRYDYSNITRRPDYCWPDGQRLAVFLQFLKNT